MKILNYFLIAFLVLIVLPIFISVPALAYMCYAGIVSVKTFVVYSIVYLWIAVVFDSLQRKRKIDRMKKKVEVTFSIVQKSNLVLRRIEKSSLFLDLKKMSALEEKKTCPVCLRKYHKSSKNLMCSECTESIINGEGKGNVKKP